MGRDGWQRGMPPRSHHPMTGYHHATRLASEDDTWCGMKAYGRRGRATVRSSDHSLAITCPNLPPPTGYFVKPTIPFDRISSRPCTAQCRPIYMERSDKPTKCVLYTPEGLTAYKGYMAPMFGAIVCTFLFFRLNGPRMSAV